MKNTFLISKVLLLMLVGLLTCGSARAADWRFPVGLSYVSGFDDVVDLCEDNLEEEGYDVDTWDFPVGVSFHPYVQFDNGFRVGTGIGPLMVILGDVDHLDIPLNVNAGYTFVPSADVSPYIRAGIMYHVATGDYVEGSTPGFFGAVGMEFLRQSPVGFGFEIALDTSEIELEKYERSGYYGYSEDKEDIEPIDVMFTIYAVF